MMRLATIVALACGLGVNGDLMADLQTKVTVYDTSGQAAASIVGVMSRDGPTVNELGVVGKMVVSQPDIFACNGEVSTLSTLFQGLFMMTDGVRPVALIERSPPDADGDTCTFEDKVRAVQSAGAAAAIIFDYKSEGPVFMSYTHPEGVEIPAVFISNEAGQALVEAIARTNGQVNPIVHLVAAQDATDVWAMINTMQFEYLSFSTGYSLLAIFIIPVAIYNLIAAIRRRRKVEALYALMFGNAELNAKVTKLSAPWMRPMPLPFSMASKERKTACQRLHRFLVLVLLCYLWQMMCSSMWFDANPTSAAEETRTDAVDWGISMVMDAVFMACAIVLLRALIGCMCRVACCMCRRSTEATTTIPGDHYVALKGSVNDSNEEDKKTVCVHAGIPLSLHELHSAKGGEQV